MNDFTKEEMMQIKYDYDLNGNRYDESFTNEQCEALYEKIQSMIDNYCEHEWAMYISSEGNAVRCTKCNHDIQE